MIDESRIQVIWRQIGDQVEEGLVVDGNGQPTQKEPPARFLVLHACRNPGHGGPWLLLDAGVPPRHFVSHQHAIDVAELIAYHENAQRDASDRVEVNLATGTPVQLWASR